MTNGNEQIEQTETDEVNGQQPDTSQEKMLPQSEVNRLVGSAKAEAQQRARQQVEQEFNEHLKQLETQKQSAEARGESTQEIDTEKVYQEVTERIAQSMQQKQAEQEMQQVANGYLEKLENGKKNYEDFDEVVKEFNPAEFPQIVYLVHNMENAADVVYELSKNPSKLATIDYLSQRAPQKARSELQRMSTSIEENRIAKQQEEQAQTEAPLDRMTPTQKTGNGQLSITDLKQQPWLRG